MSIPVLVLVLVLVQIRGLKVLTFASLSISAYVLPSYSKIGSQPGRLHQYKYKFEDSLVALALDRYIPKFVGPRGRTIVPYSISLASSPSGHTSNKTAKTYRSPPLENKRLLTRPATKSKSTHSLRAAVLKTIKHLVQTLMAQRFHERFAKAYQSISKPCKRYSSSLCALSYMYGPGRPLRALNSSAVSSVNAGPLI